MSETDEDVRAKIMAEFPNMDMKSVAAGLRDGTIRLSVPVDRADLRTPDVEAWLRLCNKKMADVLDPPN